MNPIFPPDRAQDLALVLAVAVPVAIAAALVIGARLRRRGAGGTSAARPASSAWFWVLVVGAGVALGWTQAGSRRGSAGLVALTALAAAVPVVGIAGRVAWQAAAVRLGYRATFRAERRAARGDVDGAIAALRASVDRRSRRSPPPDPADAWAPPPSVDARDRALAVDLGTLGRLEALRGDWAAAAGHHAAAERFGDLNQVAYARVARGDALYRLGRVDEGVALIRQGVELCPPDDPAARSQLGHHLAAALIELGRPDEAAAALDAAVADWGRAAPPDDRAAEVAAARAQIAAARGDGPAAPG